MLILSRRREPLNILYAGWKIRKATFARFMILLKANGHIELIHRTALRMRRHNQDETRE